MMDRGSDRFRKLVLAALVGLSAVGCESRADVAGRDEFTKRFTAAVSQAVKTGATALDLASLTTFEWEQMHACPAFSWPDGVSKRLGFFWAGGFRSETNRDDRYVLLVFTKGKRVVMWVDFPREIAGFYPLFKQGPIARSNPNVSLHKVGDYVTVTRPGAARSPEAIFKRFKDGGRTVEVVRADQLGVEPRRQPETSK